ncbi:unnamed protein product [Ranitomeya imitator]|uniref:Uncharacterized protein n=1 Tax=Ranitomeya imitator TaxID=111125 RepID=A0ABN9M5K5_9NEOB|nr:unnamed protein product [Ranitomeya imitator]
MGAHLSTYTTPGADGCLHKVAVQGSCLKLFLEIPGPPDVASRITEPGGDTQIEKTARGGAEGKMQELDSNLENSLPTVIDDLPLAHVAIAVDGPDGTVPTTSRFGFSQHHPQQLRYYIWRREESLQQCRESCSRVQFVPELPVLQYPLLLPTPRTLRASLRDR